ncbi:MAG: aminotransferase class IV, partial [Planctomycetota bacterium]|nr:aminotransferase class IV [Planctomycetota bacterium]
VNILAGLTRRTAIDILAKDGIQVREMPFGRDALYVADEIFMTGTAAEITPVRSVDGMVFPAGAPGPVTKRLQDDFFAIVKGESPDRHGWLTHVAEASS